MSYCLLPSLLLHSSLSVQFELDCLARKHRGIASWLGRTGTAGTNKTGINLTGRLSKTLLEELVGFDNKIPFGPVSQSGKVIIEKFSL